jgi:hypothetical protein
MNSSPARRGTLGPGQSNDVTRIFPPYLTFERGRRAQFLKYGFCHVWSRNPLTCKAEPWGTLDRGDLITAAS